MRIQSISTFNLNFSSRYNDFLDDLEENNGIHSCIQYDDYGATIRERMRANMLSRSMPIVNSDTNSSLRFASTLEESNIQNLQKIATNCYRGASLSKYKDHFELLKKSGVDTVIDLEGYHSLKKTCEDNKVDYYPYIVDAEFWSNPIFKTDEELIKEHERSLLLKGLKASEYKTEKEIFQEKINKKRDLFIHDLKKLFDVINKKSFYICCEFGEYRTPNILAINSLFNPDWKGKETYPSSHYMYKIFEKMYNNLTTEHKTILGIDEVKSVFLKEHFKKMKNIL